MTLSDIKHYFIASVVMATLAGCASTGENESGNVKLTYNVERSFLHQDKRESSDATDYPGEQSSEVNQPKSGFERLKPILSHNVGLAERIESDIFNQTNDRVKVSANRMSSVDFIHYVFGEIFDVNYVIGNELAEINKPLTLNIQNETSKNELYRTVSKILAQSGVRIEFNENTFYFHKPKSTKGSATVGVGREFTSVPNVSGNILQVVQLQYGIRITLERTLNKLVDAEFIPDFSQNSMFILGDRTNVIRALELINMLDVPAHRGKYIGLLSLDYIAMSEFTDQVVTLLTNEGVDAAINTSDNKSVLLVPLAHIGAIAVFASSEESLARVRYWATILDRPTQGENAQYFIYTPEYARAADLGESIGGLLGISGSKLNKDSTGDNAQRLSSGRTSAASRTSSGLSFVVDERTNSLIFNTTGDQYQKLLPLLAKLDILPKQILLEVTIAEVTLTDTFKYGVEFALKNDERFNASTLGQFGGQSAGGLTLSIFDDDIFGGTGDAALAFFRQNQFVNVLSNPTLLVRDGMSATIAVGTEIPIQSGTVVDQGVTTTNVNYRETGVKIDVTPTLNAQGVVIMNIAQEISNVVEGTGGSPTPSIFSRALSTEAVVESGRTVILGGLISENSSQGETKVPLLGDLPLIGGAFRGQNDTVEKTELVMIVTPRVIKSSDEWDKLISGFSESLEGINLSN
ncbi:MAG: hypothetical protein GJ680_19655 [Alteromonadaceae bacterium]|nr:hypothetical protein [Alteromonadaceae bacterium]